MKRDTRLYIDDILYAIKNIEKYLKGLSFEDFSKDSKTVDAVVRNFEIIGEAAKQIPIQTKQKYLKIPWRMMAGMRDKLIHAYFGVDNTVIWKAAKEDVLPLRPMFEELLQNLDASLDTK